jgi:outer membrane protein OmpA-like peptidoglycan-associated protein
VGLPTWIFAASAWGAGVTADVELFQPTFSSGAPLGLDVPPEPGRRDVRWGVLVGLEDDPVVLYENGEERGSIVHRRTSAVLGAAIAVDGRTTVRVQLPFFAQRPGAETDFSTARYGLGDLRAGLRTRLHDDPRARVALRLDVDLPTGTAEAWMGDAEPRGSLGTLVAWPRGAWTWNLDTGVTLRRTQDTGYDLHFGPDLTAAGGLTRRLGRATAVSAVAFARIGLTRPFSGSGGHAVESIGSFAWRPGHGPELTIGAGRGFTAGIGAPDWRAVGRIVFHAERARPRATVAVAAPTPSLPEAVETEDPTPPPAVDTEAADAVALDPPTASPALATESPGRIEVRDPIRFYVGTSRIRPESLPTLAAIARLLDDSGIALLVIEGHASDEGSYAYNYGLSTDRSRSVYEALIRYGIAPERLAFRGLGEVVPGEGRDASRRVEFRVMRLPPGTEVPPKTTVQPWDGQPPEAE